VLLATLSVVAAGLAGGCATAVARGRDPAAGGDPVVAWTRQFGTGGADWAHGVAVEASGAAYVVGDTNGGFPGHPSGGSYDAFIRKYAPGGTVVWTRQFGTDEVDLASGVAVDSTGAVFVVGVTDGRLPGQLDRGDRDAFIRKYAPGGAVLWTRQFGTHQGDVAETVAVHASGTVDVVGDTYGTFAGQSHEGSQDAFVRTYAPGGAVLWTRQFGTSKWDVALGVAVDASGAAYVAGDTDGSFAGQPDMIETDAYIRKYAPGGAVVWTRQFGTDKSDIASAVAVHGSGAIYVIGSTDGAFAGQSNRGDRDAFLRRYVPGS
jgi:hypothetical protein